MRRIALFIATNLAVLLLLSIVCRLFGIDQMAATRRTPASACRRWRSTTHRK